MTEIIAWILAAAGMGTTWWFARRCRTLEAGLLAQTSLPVRAAGNETPPNPLSGLRIAVDVSQDHPQAPLVTMLVEQLLAEDAVEVRVATDDGYDLLITGEVQCNGYSDVYFRAEFACKMGAEVVLRIAEKPVHGDRPANLVLELTSRLKEELNRRAVRNERRSALRELGR